MVLPEEQFSVFDLCVLVFCLVVVFLCYVFSIGFTMQNCLSPWSIILSLHLVVTIVATGMRLWICIATRVVCICVFVFLCFCVFVFLCSCVFVSLCFCVLVFLFLCAFVVAQ